MALFERDYVEENNKKSPGSGLFSHAVASAVSSVLKRFTTVFGMGTGGSVSLVPPRDLNSISLFRVFQDRSKHPCGITRVITESKAQP